jgi:hypothetical protein
MGWRILVFYPEPEAKDKIYLCPLTHVKTYNTFWLPWFVVNVPVDELSSARIWQHKLCATLSASVNINYHLAIKVYYRIGTLQIRADDNSSTGTFTTRKSVTRNSACANEIILNRSFASKAKEGRHIRICHNFLMFNILRQVHWSCVSIMLCNLLNALSQVTDKFSSSLNSLNTEKDQDIRRWNSRFWLGTGTKG